MKKTAETYEHRDYWFELELEDGKWKVDAFNKKKDKFGSSFIGSADGFDDLETAIKWCNDFIEEEEKVDLNESENRRY